ncbi:MAG: hypothetical protein V4461_13150 [Pseudomonadota bacterium]
MYLTDWMTRYGHHDLVICPACGESDYEDCHPDPHLHHELVREADGLVQEGRTDKAVEILTALYARHIAAFVRPRWRCRCGVKFHA